MRFQRIADEDHVAERFAHLLAIQRYHPAVNPEAREWPLASHRLGLGDLGWVMREDQVAPAAVDIQLRAEVARGHRRTLDMPARPTWPPRAFPGRLIWP